MNVMFDLFWRAYKLTPARDLVSKTIKISGKPMLLNHVLARFWNDDSDLPTDLRKEIIAELDEHRPALINMGGNREPDPRYWRERIWRYSQAARALKPLLERKMVMPGRYPPPR